jgi:hypothetical protein
VVEPGLADRPELAREPARDDVDCDPSFRELRDRGDLLGRQCRFQGPGRIAAITVSRVVAAASAWLKATDSCWYSAP